jgi:hypothetical protein
LIVSIANQPGSWRSRVGDWVCAIEADLDNIKHLSRVWIPYQTIEENEILWYRKEEIISSYVKSQVTDDPEKALRFSYSPDSEYPDKLTLAIPIETLNDDDLNLNIWGKCWPTREELEIEYASKPVNWKSWGEFSGDPGPEPKPKAGTIWPKERVRIFNRANGRDVIGYSAVSEVSFT